MAEFLNSTRKLPASIGYTPKVGCAQRSMEPFRSDTALGESGLMPYVLRDNLFWSAADYDSIIGAVIAGGSRDWSIAQPTKRTSGVPGIKSTKWEEIRGASYKNTEMVGAMIAAITYDGMTEYIVSAAPNLLYKEPGGGKKKVNQATGYHDHVPGDNVGTQIHSEMIFAAQLRAFLTTMASIDELPLGTFKPRKGLILGGITLDADLFIEKNSMCQGCVGTWNQFVEKNVTVAYRAI